MTATPVSLPNLLMQKFASSKPGAWLLARFQHHIDRAVLKLSGERLMLSSVLAGLPVVMVNTVGAKSGIERRIPLLCIMDQEHPDSFAIIASNFGQKNNPAWYYNLKANSRVSCSLDRKPAVYVAEEAEKDGADYQRFWQYALDTYIGFPKYKERASHRHIPIMVLRKQ